MQILSVALRFHETLAYKKPMDVYQESIKLNQEKAKAS
jgi:putative transposase